MNPEIIIPVSVFAMTFGIAYIAIISSHREKMNMIEKGIDPKEFKRLKVGKGNPTRSGLVLLAIGLGLIVGSWVDKTHVLPVDGLGIPSFICVFIGAALLINARLNTKKA